MIRVELREGKVGFLNERSGMAARLGLGIGEKEWETVRFCVLLQGKGDKVEICRIW